MELPSPLPPAGSGPSMDRFCGSPSGQDTGGLEGLGSTKPSRDPAARCGGLQTDPPVPALRFCGQLAKWTGSSSNHQGDVGVNSSVFFEALPGEIASSRLELRNEGNTAIFYSWQKLRVSSSVAHLLPHKRTCFYFNQSSGVILPGATQHVDLMFKSRMPGLHTESWQLQTHPLLLQGASVQVTLMGSAAYEDKTAELRRHLETRLEKTVTEKFCRSLVYKILEGIQTRERSSALVEFLMGGPRGEICGGRQESVEQDPSDQSLGCGFADDRIFTDFTSSEEEAYSAVFASSADRSSC